MNIDIDIEEAVDRIGDRDIYVEVAHLFAEHIPTYIDTLNSALFEENWETLGRTAHTVKSNCATVGAKGLQLIAAQLEKEGFAKNSHLSTSLAKDLTCQLALLQNILEVL